MAEDLCCSFRRGRSSISFGGLCFLSSLWPTTISSSCWTRLPEAGSSSPWSRGTSGGPSTAPSSPPDSTVNRGRGVWKEGRKSRAGKKWLSKEMWETESRGMNCHIRGRRRDGQAGWQTVINTSLWLRFHVCTNLFWLLLHFIDKHCRRHLQRRYYGWNHIDERRKKNPPPLPLVSVFLGHNNCCCYRISLE